MELKDTIQKRHSIRNFIQKKLSIEIIYKIIEYANLAPSAGNLQARDFIIIDKKEIKEKLSFAALNQKFISEAPINIVVCANLNRISPYGNRGIELYCIQDASVAAEHILLLAIDNGLSACWVGAFDENMVSNILNLPSYIRPLVIIPIGYRKGKIEFTPRIDIEYITHYNNWEKKYLFKKKN